MINGFDLEMLDFIKENPTPFHLIAAQADALKNAGFIQLYESEEWELVRGGKYFVTRNDSSLIAFRIPNETWSGFAICASHSDSPCLYVKENPDMAADGLYAKLNAELYGGTIRHTWFDRPLSVGGRVCIKKDGAMETLLVNTDRDLLMIPSLAVHMDKSVNDGKKIYCTERSSADSFIRRFALF